MTNMEPDGPYTYQPFGSVSHPNHATAGRLWGVSGVSPFTTMNGLTQDEALACTKVLREMRGLPPVPSFKERAQ